MTVAWQNRDALPVYFLGVLAYNATAAVLAYLSVWTLRKNEVKITWLSGAAVFVGGWLFGSVAVLLCLVLYQIGGLEYETNSLRFVTSWVVLAAVMYPLYTWLGKRRTEAKSVERLDA